MIGTSFLSGILFAAPGGFYLHDKISRPQMIHDPIVMSHLSAENPAHFIPVSFSPDATKSLPVQSLRTARSGSQSKKKIPSNRPLSAMSTPASSVVREITNQEAPPVDHKSAIHIEHIHESNLVNPVLLAGWQAYQNGNFDVASEHYSRVLSQDSDNHNSPSRDALLGMAAIAQQRSQDHVAARFYNQMLALDPLDPDAHAGMISLLGEKGLARTESRLKLLLTQHPEAAVLHFALGNHFAELSLWAEAEQAYFSACKLDIDNAQYAFNLAISLDHLGKLNQAEHHYRRALQLDSSRNAGFDHPKTQFRLDELKAP